MKPPLLFGPYLPPRHHKGSWITDEIHGLVQVNGWTNGPLSWPTRKWPSGGPRSIAVTKDLVRAIRQESEVAVAHWFGVSTKKIRELRRELGVSRNTIGTLHQHAAVAEPPPPAAGRRRQRPRPHFGKSRESTAPERQCSRNADEHRRTREDEHRATRQAQAARLGRSRGGVDA